MKKIRMLLMVMLLVFVGCKDGGSSSLLEHQQTVEDKKDEDIIEVPKKENELIEESNNENVKVNNTEIIQKIDERVSWIKKNNDYQIVTEYENFEEFYIQNELVRRYFFIEPEQEKLCIYYLYYDEFGVLILSEVTHYRSYAYSIYFDKDEAIYIYWDENSKLNGDLEDHEGDDLYSMILDDVKVSLDYAYRDTTKY